MHGVKTRCARFFHYYSKKLRRMLFTAVRFKHGHVVGKYQLAARAKGSVCRRNLCPLEPIFIGADEFLLLRDEPLQ